jgi:hypothetical protein
MTRCRLASCRQLILKPAYHARGVTRYRKYCSKSCWDADLRNRRLAVVGRTPTARPVLPSPHRVPTWAAVPPECPRCGGLWRRVDYGVCCRLCGRDLFVAAALIGLEPAAAPR